MTMRPGLRARQAVNLANFSTPAGLAVAVLGGARPARSVDGLFTAHRLPAAGAARPGVLSRQRDHHQG